ncbi:6562_t:CDS:2 [Racocetra persica]|uniref:6562_t:CDS:1 n=1 Tax=Racocetra persica TaxID=160502 RepID=A0ACA9QF80_9GLOM|nr:6562_t:CDS:2 [Racocetra persica]
MARQNEEWDDEDEHEDIPITRRQKEREMADKIAKTLLPSQKIKFSPVKGILISEIIFQTLQPRKNFIDTVIHELAHASDDVRFHPDFDPWSLEFQE